MSNSYYCPECGKRAEVRLIERIDGGDEFKDAITCDSCENIFYVIVPKTEKEMSESVLMNRGNED